MTTIMHMRYTVDECHAKLPKMMKCKMRGLEKIHFIAMKMIIPNHKKITNKL